jgi:hypothetical protein
MGVSCWSLALVTASNSFQGILAKAELYAIAGVATTPETPRMSKNDALKSKLQADVGLHLAICIGFQHNGTTSRAEPCVAAVEERRNPAGFKAQ